MIAIKPENVMRRAHPEIIDSIAEGETNLTLSLSIPAELIFFQGHFPNAPILPGVVQLDWALYFAHQFFHIKREEFLHIDQLKFTQVIKPNATLFLELKLEGEVLTFKYFNRDSGVVHSLGKIRK